MGENIFVFIRSKLELLLSRRIGFFGFRYMARTRIYFQLLIEFKHKIVDIGFLSLDFSLSMFW